MQLDQGRRGFSFSQDGPLDMRMDPHALCTAEDIVNTWSEKKLGEIFRELGEEPRWRSAARAIVEARRRCKIRTTKQLSDIILAELRGKIRGKLHPATLVFQGLRICVNQELDVLREGLGKALGCFAPRGKMGVISFHRLEDRIVKDVFRTAVCPVISASVETPAPLFRLLTKKPVVPTAKERRVNPRSRSAKMRFLERK